MLYDYFVSQFLYHEDWNCAEHVLVGANRVYGLGLPESAMKLAAGFGGGVSSGDICGALTGAIMVLGALFVKERAHESDRIKVLTNELLNRYRAIYGDVDCTPLKEKHRTEERKCSDIILDAVKILDDIVARELPEAPFVKAGA